MTIKEYLLANLPALSLNWKRLPRIKTNYKTLGNYIDKHACRIMSYTEHGTLTYKQVYDCIKGYILQDMSPASAVQKYLD